MSGWNPRANEIFLKAVEHSMLEDCRTFIDQACAGDAALRAEVEDLLQAHSAAGSFLDAPAIARTIDMPAEPPIAAAPGTVIGPYKLLQQIGEGGMGVVYMADQLAPVRRKVALKIIKPGMDTREVIARFEAERQALALMDHPHIARVFDAGATAAGRPYFVMELVRGVPITDYCDQNNLPVHERLELFVTVCHAVQHAHQKGIIHRDIKPSNVLVTLHDGHPLPKVIDFGVAKAIGQQLTDKTLFTQFAQMVGTPLYMSPEQAQLTGQDVDTRGDIYSLGVMLYELLTGTTPFERGRLKQAALDEIRRMIREEDPPSPSARLSSTAGETQTAVAAHRRVDPRGLSRLVRGDLDWIVMKALEKDRSRRYETANGFAADIGRYLSDEPVLACPPSAAYWLRKFVHRHKGLVLASMVVLAALVLGIAGTTIGLLQARAERDKVLAAQKIILAAQKKERLALIEAEENFQTAREAVDRMYTRAAEEMRGKPQLEQLRRALLEDALRFYRGFLKKKSDDPAIRYESALAQRRVGEIYGFLGNLTDSLENHREATATLAALGSQFAKDVNYRDELARAHFHTGYVFLALLRLDEGAVSMEEAMALWESLANEFTDRPSCLEDLARANIALGLAWQKNYSARGDRHVARGQELLARLRQRFPRHEISAGFKSDLEFFNAWRYAWLPHDATTLTQLEQECRDQLADAEAESRKFPDAPDYQNNVAEWLGRLVNVLAALNRSEEASQLCQRILEMRTRLATQYPDSPEFQKNLAWAHYHFGMALYEANRSDEALEPFRRALSIAGELVEKYPENLRAVTHLCGMLTHCPVAQLRDPKRALVLALRIKELGQVGWEGMAIAQIDAGQYREALETCEKSSRAGQHTVIISYATAIAYWHLGRQAEARELVRQNVEQIGSQPNHYWYIPEYRWRTRETAKLMGPEFDELKAADPEKVLRNGVALYRRLAEERPDDPGLLKELAGKYKELAQLLNNRGPSDEGEQLLSDAAAAYAQLAGDHSTVPLYRDLQARAHFDLGLLQQQRGRNQEGEQNYRQALAIWTNLAVDVPNESIYRVHAANVLTYQLTAILTAGNRLAEAAQTIRQGIAALEKLAVEFPDRNEYRRNLGEAYLILSGQYLAAQRSAEAEQLCSKALERWPDHPFILAGRARSYLALKQPDKALPDISRAIELAPNDGYAPWWYLDRATAYCGLQQTDQARAELSRAIELWPNLWDARVWRADFHRDLREWDAAVADYSKALELNPNYAPAWQSRGGCYANLGQWDRVLTDYAKVVEVNPLSPGAHNNLGWLLATCVDDKLRDPRRAVESAKKSVELAPAAGAFWNTLGIAHYRAGNWQVAIDALTRSNDLMQGDKMSFNGFFLAMALWQLDRQNEARQWFDKSAAWMDANAKDNAELIRFRGEASALLGSTQTKDDPAPAIRPGNAQ
jgi:serine/threonine protein kinase/Tfp pilus assembly protein PilF